VKVFELLVESFSPRMTSVLHRTIEELELLGVDYSVGGAVALSNYTSNPRMTKDIDVFVDADQKHTIDRAFIDAGFELVYASGFQTKLILDGVEVDVLYAGNDAERWASKHHVPGNILGVTLNVVDPETLLWLYVLSEKDQNFVDAVELIKSTKVGVSTVEKNLDSIHLEKLKRIVARSKEALPKRTRN